MLALLGSHYRWVILGLAIFAQISGAMVGSSLPPLAPLFQRDLGLSKAEVGTFIAATYLGGLTVLLLAGSLADRYGVRITLTLSQVLAGSLLLSMTFVRSSLQAVIVMGLVGAARSPVLISSTRAIMEWFSPAIRGTAMGLKQTGGPLGWVIAATLLPTLGLAVGWRLAVAVIGVFAIAAGLVTALLYSPPPVATARTAEPRSSVRASLDSVLHNRGLWTIGSVAFLFGLAQQCFSAYTVLYFHEVVLVPLIPDDRARLVAAGGYLAVSQTGSALGRVLWGVVSDRLLGGRRLGTLAAVGFLGAVAALAVGHLPPGWPMGLLAVVVFFAGITGLGWSGVYHALAVETAGGKHAATGLGLCMTLMELGMTVGPPLFGLAVDLGGSYRPGWILAAVVSAGAGLAAARAAAGRR